MPYIIPHVISQQEYGLYMYQYNAKNMKMDWESDESKILEILEY